MFGDNIDYATIKKVFEGTTNYPREGYSPCRISSAEIKKIIGRPNYKKICTSYVERQNLTMRTNIKRFTRLSIVFSKKLDNLKAMLALHFWNYNFMRRHTTLRMTPAMAAGITKDFLNWDEVI